MALYSICFSPTGGTQKVLQILQNAWDTPAQEIDLTVPGADYASYHFAHTDVCLIAVPSFGGRVPSVALERLRFMHADRTPTVLIAVYGNRAIDDTLLELQRELRPNGFEACAAISAVAEHSIMHQFGTGRPDSATPYSFINLQSKFSRYFLIRIILWPRCPATFPTFRITLLPCTRPPMSTVFSVDSAPDAVQSVQFLLMHQIRRILHAVSVACVVLLSVPCPHARWILLHSLP